MWWGRRGVWNASHMARLSLHNLLRTCQVTCWLCFLSWPCFIPPPPCRRAAPHWESSGQPRRWQTPIITRPWTDVKIRPPGSAPPGPRAPRPRGSGGARGRPPRRGLDCTWRLRGSGTAGGHRSAPSPGRLQNSDPPAWAEHQSCFSALRDPGSGEALQRHADLISARES